MKACLREQAEELKKKNTWVRRGLGNILQRLEKLDVDEDVPIRVMPVETPYSTESLLITPGSRLVLMSDDYDLTGGPTDPYPKGYWEECAPMDEVRRFVNNLPAALEKMSEQLEERADYEPPESIRKFFDMEEI